VYRVPSATAKYGIVHPSLSQTPSPANYYASVSVLARELRTPAWVASCDGYYVSSVDYGIPRLSYFSASADKALLLIDAICRRTGLQLAKPAQPLSAVAYAPSYGGTETGFRKYLCDYTQIGLDLLAADVETAQRLCATYRWQVVPSGRGARPYLEPTIQLLSKTYQAFSRHHRTEFWHGFTTSEPALTPWDHMLVNQVLCFDEIPPPQLTSGQITGRLASRGHTVVVPDGWTP
jgi:hypothetical protein